MRLISFFLSTSLLWSSANTYAMQTPSSNDLWIKELIHSLIGSLSLSPQQGCESIETSERILPHLPNSSRQALGHGSLGDEMLEANLDHPQRTFIWQVPEFPEQPYRLISEGALHDGDCGFHVLGISRADAIKTFREAPEAMRNHVIRLMRPEMQAYFIELIEQPEKDEPADLPNAFQGILQMHNRDTLLDAEFTYEQVQAYVEYAYGIGGMRGHVIRLMRPEMQTYFAELMEPAREVPVDLPHNLTSILQTYDRNTLSNAEFTYEQVQAYVEYIYGIGGIRGRVIRLMSPEMQAYFVELMEPGREVPVDLPHNLTSILQTYDRNTLPNAEFTYEQVQAYFKYTYRIGERREYLSYQPAGDTFPQGAGMLVALAYLRNVEVRVLTPSHSITHMTQELPSLNQQLHFRPRLQESVNTIYLLHQGCLT